jgi:hypothetical protein
MPCFNAWPNQFRIAVADSPVSCESESMWRSLGSTLYLLNHVAQTSAASSLSPNSPELDGVVWVSTAQLDPVTEAVPVKGEYPKLPCRLASGKSCTYTESVSRNFQEEPSGYKMRRNRETPDRRFFRKLIQRRLST